MPRYSHLPRRPMEAIPMPERRLAKTRRSLPEGYQFGDARQPLHFDGQAFSRIWESPPMTPTEHWKLWLRLWEDWPTGWNTIEADEHGDEWAI